MLSAKRKLRLAGAFAALAMLALAVSCTGFFKNPTLTSIAISPTSPQVQQGMTLQLQAFGTFDDGTRSQIRSGVSWSSDAPSVAAVDPSTGILSGVVPGTATVSASAQALSSTATATVFIVINSITISPTSASVTSGGTQPFTVTANGGINITSGSVLTPESNGVVVTTISCGYDSTQLAQVCTDNGAIVGTYQIVASYPGSTLTATATLNVQ
jgi:trimeric autotransporter adhesin